MALASIILLNKYSLRFALIQFLFIYCFCVYRILIGTEKLNIPL